MKISFSSITEVVLNKSQMGKKIQLHKITDNHIVAPMKIEWRKSLLAPQDGMWESFMENATHWMFKEEHETIGYACVDDANQVLQFFILPHWLQNSATVFKQFIHQEKITKGIVGTNNPVFQSIAMHCQKSVEVATYLFTDFFTVEPDNDLGNLSVAENDDLEKLVDFCHISMGAPKAWLTGYVDDLIKKQALFVLNDGSKIMGTCEVRTSESQPTVADIGVIVSPQYRKKGVGTYLLGKAKTIAIQWNKKPICSCEKDNIGSLKAIQNNGFRSIHQMLLLNF